MPSPIHSRDPGWMERYYIVRNTGDYYTNFNITIKLDKRITKKLLSNALRSLISKNPWYVINFFESDAARSNGYSYIVRYINKLCLKDAVKFHDIDDFDVSKILSDVNDVKLPLNSDTSLWKLHIYTDKLHNQYLCAIFDHSIFDGGSGTTFQQELVNELNLVCKFESEENVNGDGLKADNDVNVKEVISEEDSYEDILYEYNPQMPDIPSAAQLITNIYDLPLLKRAQMWLLKYVPGNGLSNYVQAVQTWLLNYVPEINQLCKKFLGVGIKYLPQRSLKPVHMYLTPDFDYKKNNLKTDYININFTPEEASKIIKYCRSEKFTLTPYLNVLLLKCLQETVFEKNKDISHVVSESSTETEESKDGLIKIGKINHISKKTEPISTESFIAIQGRRYINKPAIDLKGVLVSAQTIILPPIEDEKKTTKEVYESMQKNLESRESFQQFGMLKYMDHHENLEKAINNPIKKTITVSNLGRIPTTNNKYNIIDIIFGLSVGFSYNVVLNVISSIGGMNVTVGYFPGYGKKMEDCVSEFKRRILTDIHD